MPWTKHFLIVSKSSKCFKNKNVIFPNSEKNPQIAKQNNDTYLRTCENSVAQAQFS